MTRVNAGTLNVTSPLVQLDSAHLQIPMSPTVPATFAADTPVVQSLVVSAGSYAGHGSQALGDLNSRADIIAGTNSGAFTGGDATLAMQWRQRSSGETGRTQGGDPASPPLPSVNAALISDILKLTGMASGTADPLPTDPFVLQMTYDPSELSDEAARAAAGAVYSGWLNPTGGPGGEPLSENAIAGNAGNNATLAEQNFQGDFATFQAGSARHSAITSAVRGASIRRITTCGPWSITTANSSSSPSRGRRSCCCCWRPGSPGGVAAVRVEAAAATMCPAGRQISGRRGFLRSKPGRRARSRPFSAAEGRVTVSRRRRFAVAARFPDIHRDIVLLRGVPGVLRPSATYFSSSLVKRSRFPGCSAVKVAARSERRRVMS